MRKGVPSAEIYLSGLIFETEMVLLFSSQPFNDLHFFNGPQS